MTIDRTEQQGASELLAAEQLSRRPTAPPATLPGYRLERFLGAGTFGQVWAGHDLNTGRPVAVKFYLHRGGVNWSLLSREVKNLVQLSAQRSIVQILDVGWDAEPPYYVMELLPNGSLEDLLQRVGRLPVQQAVEIFRTVCNGLNQCHSRGVLHCDLKPGNILLDADLVPRLADFGQSRMSNDQSPSLGTLFYMAPEQAQLDAAPNASWDVYALGVILYRMLTGSVPHRNDTLVQQIDTAGSLPKRLEYYRQAIGGDHQPSGHRRRRGVDRDLARIVDRCLAADPQQRFSNVQQVLAALDQRDQAKARQPLLLLGIVGPMLLLLAGGVFAGLGIVAASDRATQALRTEAHGSNLLAARFAAKSLESELQRYFQVLDQEARHAELLAALREVLHDDELLPLRQAIAAAPKDSHDSRAQLLENHSRQRLDQLLRQRLESYQQPDSGQPNVSTMLITDAWGNMLAAALDSDVSRENLSTGYNFAFRSYFHGGAADAVSSTQPATTAKPLTHHHLSAAFQSTATGMWKIAFSRPIYLQRPTPGTSLPPPDGVIVMTTNLGDFESMRGGQLTDQLAVVIDARAGELQGTVLQHPLMAQHAQSGHSLAGERYRINERLMQDLLSGKDVDYIDPMANAAGGGPYRGPWLAAIAPIQLPRTLNPSGAAGSPSGGPPAGATNRAPSDRSPSESSALGRGQLASQLKNQPTTDRQANFLVLVQYRLAKVLEPVGELKRQLLWQGSAALLLVVALTVAMWVYVARLTNPQRWDEVAATSSEPSHHQATLPLE